MAEKRAREERIHGVPLSALQDAPEDWYPTGHEFDDYGVMYPTFKTVSPAHLAFQNKIRKQIRDEYEATLPSDEELQREARSKKQRQMTRFSDIKEKKFFPHFEDLKNPSTGKIGEFSGVALVFIGTHGEWTLNEERNWDLFETPIDVELINQTSCGVANYYDYHLTEKYLDALMAVPLQEDYAEQVRAVMNEDGCKTRLGAAHLPCRKDSDYMADRVAGNHAKIHRAPKGEQVPNKLFLMQEGEGNLLRKSYIIDPISKKYLVFTTSFSLDQLLKWLAAHGITKAVIADFSCNVFHGQEHGSSNRNVLHKDTETAWPTVKEGLTKNGWHLGGVKRSKKNKKSRKRKAKKTYRKRFTYGNRRTSLE